MCHFIQFTYKCSVDFTCASNTVKLVSKIYRRDLLLVEGIDIALIFVLRYPKTIGDFYLIDR